MNAAPLQSLWVGDRLSALEQLSIRSFLAHGHAFDLYTYGPVANVPFGVTFHEAAEILPASAIFKSRDYLAGFSDCFRWKLLADRGGWWVDLDVVALRPFDLDDDYVFSSQNQGSAEIPTSGITRAPAGSAALRWMSDFCQSKMGGPIGWTEVGPDLVAAAVARFHLEAHVRRAAVFCPIAWDLWEDLLRPLPSRPIRIADAYSVHLWSSMWARVHQDRDAAYPPSSLYEELKRRYPENVLAGF